MRLPGIFKSIFINCISTFKVFLMNYSLAIIIRVVFTLRYATCKMLDQMSITIVIFILF